MQERTAFSANGNGIADINKQKNTLGEVEEDAYWQEGREGKNVRE